MDRNRTTTQREMPHQVFISTVPPDPSSMKVRFKLALSVVLFVVGGMLAAAGASAVVHVVVRAASH